MTDNLNPIDLVQALAEYQEWDFQLLTENQICLAIEGVWRTYTITIQCSYENEFIRLMLPIEMNVPAELYPQLYELINSVNDQCWVGAFSWWEEGSAIMYRYSLLFHPDALVEAELIERMIGDALMVTDKLYPAFEKVVREGRSPTEALSSLIPDAVGGMQ
jgi:hypothetical protein